MQGSRWNAVPPEPRVVGLETLDNGASAPGQWMNVVLRRRSYEQRRLAADPRTIPMTLVTSVIVMQAGSSAPVRVRTECFRRVDGVL